MTLIRYASLPFAEEFRHFVAKLLAPLAEVLLFFNLLMLNQT